jgi:monovalent cation:H+ antiporter-2, CPA2 family
MHLAPLIRDLAIILGVAGMISLLFQRIRQPVVLGYIVAGIIIGPHTPPFQLVTDLPSIRTWAELGVIFLMFSLGLEFSFRKLARVGGSALFTVPMEALIFLPAGYAVGRAFGWSPMDGLFLGAMITISSTTIILKALDELKLKKHRFAELIFSVLVVEDLLAILLLVALGTVATSQSVSALGLLLAALKLGLVVGGWFLAGYLVVPRFIRYAGRIGSDEMLTLLSLGLCLALVVFASHFGYSAALGAFIMGSILAETPVLGRIERNMGSLRDLFGAIFFVSIGMLIDPRALVEHWASILAVCAVVITGKIVVTGLATLLSGQTVRNSVQVGMGLAQIGEFSFIIAQLGVSLQVTGDFIYSVAVGVSLITTFTTPYMIRFSPRAAAWIENRLPAGAREALNRYALQAESRRSGNRAAAAELKPLIRWGINGLATSLIFVVCSEWFLTGERDLPVVGWILALAGSAPFIWGMFAAFRGAAAVGVAFRVLTLAWIGTLSAEFFPGRYVFVVTGAVMLAVFVLLRRRLEKSYHWFERSFLSSFQPHEPAPFSHLAPWDAHLVRMEIHPNSRLVLRSIADSALRARHGVNIVAIQRGRRSIVTPKPEEVLLPRDELILLGTDEQVEGVRSELEGASGLADAAAPESGSYELRQAKVEPGSPLAGQTIRTSGIRERFHAMVVGIERGGERKINPDSDLVLREGDVLWIAGERERIAALATLLS